MQPELPWNVAGIPSETREAVRAAARREGLSLGEWMTRQIVRGFPDAVNGSAGNARAEAFEQMSALAGRLSALERQVQSGPMRQAVTALHQGLSRVADDIAGVAGQSAARIAALAADVETLTAAQAAQSSLAARIEEAIAQSPLRDLDGALERRLQAIEQRLSDVISRLDDPEVRSVAAAGSASSNPKKPEAVADLQSVSESLTAPSAAVRNCGSAPMCASEPGNASYGKRRDVPPSGALSESFAASEGFLGKPVLFLNAARCAANAAMAEGKNTADENGEASSAWFHRKRSAVIASVFAAAVMVAFGGVALTGGKISITRAVPAGAAGQQSHSAVAVASDRRISAVAERHSGAPRTQIATAVKADVAAVLSSASVGAMPSSNMAATAAAPQVEAAAAAVSAAAPNLPEQRIAALANAGNSRAQLLLGVEYLDGNSAQVNEAEAARWLARAAQQGEPLAQYRLGTLYERGRGVSADARLATHWYGLAARQGNLKAMHNLAIAFAEGSGARKDNAQAALWFARAASFGLADSQFNLAVLYERGMGVKQSLENAYRWYLIAAAQGDAESKSRAEALATQLKDSERAAGQRAAAAFRQQPLTPAANSLPVLG